MDAFYCAFFGICVFLEINLVAFEKDALLQFTSFPCCCPNGIFFDPLSFFSMAQCYGTQYLPARNGVAESGSDFRIIVKRIGAAL